MHEPSLTTESNRQHFWDRLTRKSATVALLFAMPFFFLFAYFGDPGRGVAAAGSVGMIVLVVWMRWDLRKRIWFWATVTILLLLHAPVVLLIPWPDKHYPGVVLLPLGLLDFAIVYGAIKLADKLMTRNAGAGSAS